MGKIITTLIDRFDGGISNDLRSTQANKFSITKHFDSLTYPHKLVPHRSTEADETKDYKIDNFLYARDSTTGYLLYGLGRVSGQSYAQIYAYDVDTSFTGGWVTFADAKCKSAVGGRSSKVFFYYKNFIYLTAGDSTIKRFDTTLSADFNDIYQTSIELTAQPVHHQSDANDTSRSFFNGFATTNATTNNVITVQLEGIIDGFSNLIPSINYYVSNTIGEISTATSTLIVGFAASSTNLFINR